MIFDSRKNETKTVGSVGNEDGFDGPIQRQRAIWSKRILKLWLSLYLTFWGFLTIALTAENDPLGTAMLALVLAFVGSFAVTLLFIIPHMTLSRFHKKQVTPDEILLAAAFGMGTLFVIPACLYFELGSSVMLASTLALFQGLILMSRYSSFKEQLTGGVTPQIFPNVDPSPST